jgi:hypothetical protein
MLIVGERPVERVTLIVLGLPIERVVLIVVGHRIEEGAVIGGDARLRHHSSRVRKPMASEKNNDVGAGSHPTSLKWAQKWSPHSGGYAFWRGLFRPTKVGPKVVAT